MLYFTFLYGLSVHPKLCTIHCPNAKIVRDWPDDVIRLVPKTPAVPQQPCNFAPDMSFLSAYYPPNPLAC
jgi:hypothetical protein